MLIRKFLKTKIFLRFWKKKKYAPTLIRLVFEFESLET